MLHFHFNIVEELIKCNLFVFIMKMLPHLLSILEILIQHLIFMIVLMMKDVELMIHLKMMKIGMNLNNPFHLMTLMNMMKAVLGNQKALNRNQKLKIIFLKAKHKHKLIKKKKSKSRKHKSKNATTSKRLISLLLNLQMLFLMYKCLAHGLALNK